MRDVLLLGPPAAAEAEALRARGHAVTVGEGAAPDDPRAAVLAAERLGRAGAVVLRDAAWTAVAHLARAPIVLAAPAPPTQAAAMAEIGLSDVHAVVGDAARLRPWVGRAAALVTGDGGDADAIGAALGTIGSMEFEEVRERAIPVALGGVTRVAVTGDATGLFPGAAPAWAAAPGDAEAVLALHARPEPVAEAVELAAGAGLGEVAVRLVAADVPEGDGDLLARAAAHLRGLGVVGVEPHRLLWPLPRELRPPAGTGRRERIDADTRELVFRCVPAGAPAALDALAAEVVRLRGRVDTLGELQIERSLAHLDEVLRERRVRELEERVRHLESDLDRTLRGGG